MPGSSDFRIKETGKDFAPKKNSQDFRAKTTSSDFRVKPEENKSTGEFGGGVGSEHSNTNRRRRKQKSFLERLSPAAWICICIVMMVIVGVISSNLGRNRSYTPDYSAASVSSNNTASAPVATQDSIQKTSVTNSQVNESGSDKNYASETVDYDKVEDTTPVYSEKVLKIDRNSRNSINTESVQFLEYAGTFYSQDQLDEYSFVAPTSGSYRFDISNVISGTTIRVHLFNELGEKIMGGYCKNGNGLTCDDIEAGKAYLIRLKNDSGDLASYNLKVGMEKQPIDITGVTEIHDSIEYEDQRNIYTFTVPYDGRYRFSISEMMSGVELRLGLYNHLNEKVYGVYLKNACGSTFKDLEAGEQYQLIVKQCTDIGNYILNIDYQKETVDISDYTVVKDSIEYEDQENRYEFSPSQSGEYTFAFSDISGSTSLRYAIYDHLESKISGGYVKNNKDFSFDLSSSERYVIAIVQDSEESDYTMTISK